MTGAAYRLSAVVQPAVAMLFLLEETRVFNALAPGTTLYQRRTGAQALTAAKDLGPPPADRAWSQRLSRQGRVAMDTALTAVTA
ncbi:hypothetical protein SAMN00790413_03675 [Deinococcus hopiensis KR-140]|uniref:Uncharacterized protein n=1 Tax=Deinococcus hopiensis KR-140 TaxID=695939 RepID=A0A1W1UY93_9DEIO|nr:hypothetical protein SAMN00790413_03675 [Deinococcus hopiensis KR-140]